NYYFEFDPVDGQIPYDLFLRECDADKVAMEIDVFWMVKGGGDPVKYMERYPGRFPMLHVKDMGPAPKHEMLDVGQGTINWKKILEAGRNGGVRHVFVENDEAANPLASIRTSFEYLHKLRY
ncbi:MAG: sugar phosphate isomerase/epimerase family protein, partial [Terriglobia bacterium]